MYQVYSMERPGRPWLAVVLSAVILAGTVALAVAITLHKQRATSVTLGEAQRVGSWPISIRPPEGWKAEALKGAPAEVGLLLREPGPDGRSLAVVRGPQLESGLLPTYAAGAVEDVVAWLANGERAKFFAAEAGSFGPLPGLRVGWLVARRRRAVEQVYGSVGVTPQGRVFAVLLRCPGRADRSNERLLDQVSEALEISGLGLTDDIAAAARVCGMRFEPPPDAMAVTPAGGPIKTLLLVSKPTKKPWTLTLTVMPLAPGREPRALLNDIVRNATEDPGSGVKIEVTKLKEREACRARFSAPDQPWDGELWVVSLDAQTVVVLNGRDEPPDSDLGAACQLIAETIGFAEGARPLDVKAAQSRGKELLAEIGKRHVDEWFDNWAGPDELFLINHAGQTEGFYRLRYSRPSNDAGTWRVESETRRMLPSGSSITWKRDTRVDAKGVGYEVAEVRRTLTTGGRSLGRIAEAYEYQESRGSGDDTIHKALRMGTERYGDSFKATDDFACDPTLGLVYWLAATDDQLRPVSVAFSDRFEAGLARQIIYPIGPQSVPGREPPQKALAIVVQTDSLAEACTIYFDQRGMMLHVDFGNELAFQKCTEEEFRERFSLVPGVSLSPGRRR